MDVGYIAENMSLFELKDLAIFHAKQSEPSFRHH